VRKALLALPLLLWGVQAHAQTPVVVAPYFYQSKSYCQITSLSSATSLVTANCAAGSVPVLTTKTIAEICVEGSAVRYLDTGTAPTASVGMPVTAGICFQYSGPLNQMQFINQTSGATVDITFYQ